MGEVRWGFAVEKGRWETGKWVVCLVRAVLVGDVGDAGRDVSNCFPCGFWIG